MTGTFPDDVPTLTDGVLTLRAHRESDVDAMVEQSVDPESVEWTRVPVPYSREDAVGYLGVIADGWRSAREFGFALETPEIPFAGSVSLRAYEEAGVAELAFGMHPAARGRGLCSRAVKLLLDWGFSRFEVVVWFAHVGNWASRRVAWANGFSFDGTIAKFAERRGERFDAWFGSLRAGDDRSPKHRWNVAPVLESSRLRLRPVRVSDANRFAEVMRDPRGRHFGGRVRSLLAITDGAKMVERILLAQASGERFAWCITEVGSDVLAGHIQLFDLDGLDDSEAKFGYSVHPESRGRGVLREALRIVTEWAFRPVADGGLGKRRLSLTTAVSNKASRYGAEQAGFEHVGTEPMAFPSGEEGFEDMAIYARLNPNWTTEWTKPSG
ncbi:MAG TPA: GNAT family N-acetyltransferase [Actinophytocola sp.]|jgi:RimJ/RimL family protein N-acetyltransferase|uniref:GNAT family N-acetyltransferase n=1 Tax=Actinophytocola sp. TaxID=1872138 RepID=UPI002F9384EE